MKSILITGASSGVGLGVTVELARRGWLVHAGLRDMSNRPALDSALRQASVDRERVDVVELDMTSPASIESAAKSVLTSTGGRLDAVLHNAGFTTAGFFEDLSDDDCRRLMETSFFGTLGLTRALLPAMRANRRGRIAVVTSNAVNVPHPMFSVYAAAKWALEGWCEALSLELAPFGIDVMVLQPGAHGTSFEKNVVPVVPDGSAYAHLFEIAGPRMAWIGRHQRDPRKAVLEMVAALETDRPAFRSRMGIDDKVAAALNGVLPYRARRHVVRWITGLKATRTTSGSDAHRGTWRPD